MSIYEIEYNEFSKKKKRENKNVTLFRILIILIFLIFWEILARFELINTFLFSSPYNIFTTLVNLFKSGQLFRHIGITLYEILISFILSSGLGLLFAFFLWKFKFISKVIDPYLTILNSLPKVALGPLIIIWVGTSINSIIFMSLLISMFVTIINIYNGFINTDTNYIVLMKSLKVNDWIIFKNVILPSNFSTIFNTMKVNISMNLIGVIMGELLVSKRGIGYLIMYGSQIFNINLVITSVFILGVISYLLYFFVNKLQFIFKKKES